MSDIRLTPKVPRATVPIDGREEVVRLLEDFLKQARAGLLSAVAIAGIRPRASTVATTAWATCVGVDVFRLAGAAAHLQWRLGQWIDGAEDVPPPELPDDA